ncbi:CaiB/BaiF CoA-transferase family protein [Amycolatopsis sp. FDAARGOS 1241]|uniref:CaiB/BaiF CoA transferase family protein n=1 Tax=Amycolatopsis sp. FDAARGOS 1241 TaxID=2778070 RepID=UPI001951643B|nr:CoA transferase [Amycolatopsis sp. FDAARGOS 1241]QRP50258.1 CoA transferase [Amycolatopsis sp. FDAARGOS 1241]
MSGAPLHGMAVLDLSQQLPGPYATFLLASLGADVVKVEPPAGDPARRFDPPMFQRVNAGKRNVFLDLKSEADRARLLDLAATADVFVEGFRPGVTTRLGCDEKAVRAVRPDVVYCSISGMGQTGPLAGHPTHDLSLQAMAGILRDTPESDRIGVPWVDLGTATTAALAITAAWHAGGGAHLDLSMLDVATAWNSVKPLAVTEPEATYGVVRAQDGSVVLALLEDHMWQRLCEALGWADWRYDPELATYADRRNHARAIRARLETAFADRTVAELAALAHEHDLPLGPADATGDPDTVAQLRARDRDGGPATRHTPLPLELIAPKEP